MPLLLRQESLPTPLGELRLLSDEGGILHAADWEDAEVWLHRWLSRRHGAQGYRVRTDLDAPPSAGRLALGRYFEGDLAAIDALPVAMMGTPFQRDVWTALRGIPAGSTISYGILAERIGRPRGVRAVGLANGANPISIVVPCHRVVGADGTLTGYGGGLPRKRWLLAHEGGQPRLL